jgi:hypothetical protein
MVKAIPKDCEAFLKLLSLHTTLFCDGINDETTFSRKTTGQDWIYSGC